MMPFILAFLIAFPAGTLARGSINTWPNSNHVNVDAQADACTLDVVFITFRDTDTSPDNTMGPRGTKYNYHTHDRPVGEVDGSPGPMSYRASDFHRMLAGGYPGPGGYPTSFAGTVTVANGNETLPTTYGSLRAYFEVASGGRFTLHVRIANRVENGYPVWIELPHTKQQYGDTQYGSAFVQGGNPGFFRILETATASSPDILPGLDLPDVTFSDARLVRRKVVYILSGAMFANRFSPIHPRANDITTWPDQIVYQYVMTELRGLNNENHTLDRFAGIGTHAHEFGHLLGLHHGGGNWTHTTGRNNIEVRYYGNTAERAHEVIGRANFLKWSLMQSGEEGPEMVGPPNEQGSYHLAYGSSPNPINPFYLHDLGWLDETGPPIMQSVENYRIGPGETHRISPGTGGVEFLIQRRTQVAFKGRYVSFYDYAVESTARQGLMIWRRREPARDIISERPILIVGDRRRYSDSRDRPRGPTVPEYHDMLSDPFGAGRIIDPRAGHRAQPGVRKAAGRLLQTTGFRNPEPVGLELGMGKIRYEVNHDALTDDGLDMLLNISIGIPTAPIVWVVIQPTETQLCWLDDEDPTVKYESTHQIGSFGPTFPRARVRNGETIGKISLPGEPTGQQSTFILRAKNEAGISSTTLGYTQQRAGTQVVSAPEDVTPDVDDTPAIGTYVVTDMGDGSVVWFLDDVTPAGSLELQGSGESERELHFTQAPNFEQTTTTFTATLRAESTQQVGTVPARPLYTVLTPVTVTVTDVDEDGTLVLDTTRPQVRQGIRGNLIDPDGVTDPSWTWERQTPGGPGGRRSVPERISSSQVLVPSTDFIGDQVRAVVQYTDAHGSKVLRSEWTQAVIGPPSRPQNLTAEPSDETLQYMWVAPERDNHSPVTAYGYRYGRVLDSSPQEGEEPAGRSDRSEESASVESWTSGELGVVTSHRLTGLTNGRTYRFELWAVNEAGNGDTTAVTASPALPLTQLLVAFAQASQDATEGGDAVSVTVNLSPAADRTVTIPISLTTASGEGDYSATWPGGANQLVFQEGESAQSLQITALRDQDNDTESVRLAFGSLPSGVSAGSQATSVVRLVDRYTIPCAPENFMAAPVDRRVTLTWTSGCDGGLPISGYTVQDSAAESGRTWRTHENAQSAHEIRDLNNDILHFFRVQAANDLGSGPYAQTTATPVNRRPNPPDGRTSVSFAENSTDSVATYVLSDPDGPAGLSLAISGTDGSLFEARADTLFFRQAPDWEVPGDQDLDNSYDIILKTSDGSLESDGLGVSVTVTDVGPAVPTGVSAEVISATSARVSWNATGADLAGFQLDVCSNCVPDPQWTTTVTIEDGTARSHVLEGLISQTYGVRLRARDRDDEYSAWTTPLTITVADVLEVIGASDPTFAERQTGTVEQYEARWRYSRQTASDVTWSLSGPDRANGLTLTSEGALNFTTKPDYEEPADGNSDTVWTVTVTARSGQQEARKTVNISVTNANDPGVVTMSPTSPRVGNTVLGALVDQDGGIVQKDVSWNWFTVQAGPRVEPGQGATNPYEVTLSDAGHRLRVRASYTDVHGSQTATSDESDIVLHRVLTVVFASSSYSAQEGAASVSVRVNISPAADRVVRIPITFSGSTDYSEQDLDSDDRLLFNVGDSHKTFRITATSDSDRDDETVTLGFGTLPDEVRAGSQSTSTVNLTDTTPAPNQSPTITTPGPFSVAENTTAVTTMRATDPEGQTIRWSIQAGGGIFSIVARTGALRFRTAPSYESQTSYTTTVRAADTAGGTADSTVTVNVTDVAERPSPPYVQSVSGQSRTSIQARWTAPSTTGIPPLTGYNVEYKKSSDSKYSSYSHSGTGTRATISSLEVGVTYNVRVNAVNDEGTSDWSNIATGSTQSNAPPTIQGPATVTFTENATGTVATYSKSDQNGDATTWLNLSGTDASYFDFSASNGKLTFDNPPDYETKSSYSIRVGATDTYDNTYKDVTVSLTDVGPPPTPSISISTPSSGAHEELDVSWSIASSATTASPSGWKLLHCTGHCKTFTETGWTAQTFGASTTSATLTGLRSGTQYFVRVQAQSSEGNSSWSTAPSARTEVNDPPVISGTRRLTVKENTTSAVGSFTARDPEGHSFTWSLTGVDDDKFSFTSTATALTLSFRSPPDYENPTDANTNNIYSLRIKTTDNGNPAASGDTLVNVTVRDVPAPAKMATPSASASGGTGTLDVSWTAPSSGATITSYTIEYCRFGFRRDDPNVPDDPDDDAARQVGLCSETSVQGTSRSTTLSRHRPGGPWSSLSRASTR